VYKNSIEDLTANLEFVKKVVVDNISFSYISNSKIHRFGLFANQNINKGTILGILDGQIMSWNHYDNLVQSLKASFGKYQNYIFMEWNALSSTTLLVRPFRTKYSYINHSYEPNIIIKYNPIRIETIKDIKIHEEFVLDYTKEPLRKEYLDGHGKTYL